MARKGTTLSAEHRAKLSKSHWSHGPQADALKENLRRKVTGRVLSEETKKKIAKARLGRKLSAETRAKISKAAKARTNRTIDAICEANIANGRYHPLGKTRINSSGYVMEKITHRNGGRKGEGNWRVQHRLVMERILGRTLTDRECVHHIDGNKTNNKPDNLRVLSYRVHACLNHILAFANCCEVRDAQIVLDTLFSRFGDDLTIPQSSSD